MLSRIGVHRFDALLSILTCRASIALRRPIISRYFAPTCSHRRLLSSDSPAATAAAKDRRWVMLSSYGRRCPDDSSFVADANTVAESCTSKGGRVRVSLRCAAPPSSSYLYYDFPKISSDLYYDYYNDGIRVVVAHGEWALLEMHNPRKLHKEHFVYKPAGTLGLGTPSLSLLPVPDLPTTKPESVPASYFDPTIRRPRLESGSIGLLRRGENDLLVVHVDLWYDRDAGWQKAVFCVLRPGMRRWELMKPVPVLQCGYGMLGSSPRNVICVGDRFLCCIWYCSSFLLCDMADEASPKVRGVGLPPEVWRCRYNNHNFMRVRSMGAAGDSSVRFVSIHPHCCSVERYDDDPDCCGCGDSDRKECLHPRFVFSIKTWTMNLSMDEPLEWVEDGEIDGEEIWALPGYEGLPQAIPEWPVVCLGKDNVVCFLVSNYDFTRDVEKVWMVQLNITTKTLLSVVQRSNDDDYRIEYYHLPAEF